MCDTIELSMLQVQANVEPQGFNFTLFFQLVSRLFLNRLKFILIKGYRAINRTI